MKHNLGLDSGKLKEERNSIKAQMCCKVENVGTKWKTQVVLVLEITKYLSPFSKISESYRFKLKVNGCKHPLNQQSSKKIPESRVMQKNSWIRSHAKKLTFKLNCDLWIFVTSDT